MNNSQFSSIDSLNCFGVQDINSWWNDYVAPTIVDTRDITTFVIGLASDAQAEIEMGMADQARATLNRQKWVISNKLRN